MDDLSNVTFVLAIPYVTKMSGMYRNVWAICHHYFFLYFKDFLQLFFDDLSQTTFVLIVR